MDEYFTSVEVAEKLKVHLNTVKNWIRDGEFPNLVRIGGTVRIPLSDIEALKAQKPEAS